jgi:flagellar assembly protein FliH
LDLLEERPDQEQSPPEDEEKEAVEKKDISEIEREAFQQAFEEGRRSGLQMAEKKTEAMLRRFSESIAEIASLRPSILKKTERDLVKLAIEIAKKLVHREVQIDETIIATMVRVALDRLATKEPVTLYVSAADHEVVKRHIEEILDDPSNRALELRVDDKLSRGDCVVESDYGNVDARIDEQIREIEDGLLAEF